jgi:hypothetical protein
LFCPLVQLKTGPDKTTGFLGFPQAGLLINWLKLNALVVSCSVSYITSGLNFIQPHTKKCRFVYPKWSQDCVFTAKMRDFGEFDRE